MSDQPEDSVEAAIPSVRPRRRVLRRIVGAVLLLLALALVGAWFTREEIADSVIKDQLDQLGLAATYDIESIGPRRQVLTNVVIGDPEHPDLTIERVETSLVPRWPLPGIGRIRVVKPRLYGTYIGGELSFGALDPLLFEQPPQEPFAFPDMNLLLEDGRALIESDLGDVGVKADGSGNLRDGFAGTIAATAPALQFSGCAAERVSIYGEVTINAERPGFDGPLRFASLACPDQQIALSDAVLSVEAQVDRSMDGVEGKAELAGGALAVSGNRADALDGSLQFAWRKDALTSAYKLAAKGLDTPQFALDTLALEGSARTREGLSKFEVELDAQGAGLRPGPELDSIVASVAASTQGTMIAPMLDQVRKALASEGRGSTLTAGVTLRRTEDGTSVAVPEAFWRARDGSSLLALSRFQLTQDAAGGPRYSGNFVTGGRGMPRISGRMESTAGGNRIRVKMAEYAAAGGNLEIPELLVTEDRGGNYRITGNVRASGAIPGGRVTGLELPIAASLSRGGVLEAWRDCTEIGFDGLELSSLGLTRRSLRLCPHDGEAILRNDASGFKLAALAPGVDFAGRIGSTPITIRSSGIDLNYPGNSLARDVKVAIGDVAAPSRFEFGEISLANSGEVEGGFAKGDVYLAAVPLDVRDAQGSWSFADGRLVLSDARFRLLDRDRERRFEPLAARDARLVMNGNRITANALLREPKSDWAVATAEIVHDLASGVGHADLKVEGILFDDRLQPEAITGLALGVVANVNGVVTGTGRIDWNAEEVTSTGEFSTKDLDFAAAFGPVHGVAGTIKFDDLLGLVTAPEQVLTMTSFNPGIEVDAGHLTYELDPDYNMVIHGGVWPFLGGTLILEPTTTQLTGEGIRKYTLRLIGISAAQFVERMELANISATGTFDGRVPLVFDKDGGHLDNGRLISRPPGGNLSYVGALTYQDMSPIANFAFDALRSLDFSEMEVTLDGPLTGEIVTKVRFDGIKQGATAKKNIITKQLARLPIRFNVNIHAPFYKLITAIQAMYDPAFIRDPREIGLIDVEGRPIDRPVFTPLTAIKPKGLPPTDDSLPQAEGGIQPPESENTP